MTLEQINEILNEKFENKEDRIYWEKKKAEIIRKAKNAAENEKYFRLNRKYDR